MPSGATGDGSRLAIDTSAEFAQFALQLAASQSSVMSSALPEAKVLAVRRERDGGNGTRCPVRVRRLRPFGTSQSLMAKSKLPEASARPSGEKASEVSSSV